MTDNKDFVLPINSKPLYFYIKNINNYIQTNKFEKPSHKIFFKKPNVIMVNNMENYDEKNIKLCRISDRCNINNSKGTWYHVELVNCKKIFNINNIGLKYFNDSFKNSENPDGYDNDTSIQNNVNNTKTYFQWIINTENGNIKYWVSKYKHEIEYNNINNKNHIVVRHISSIKNIIINNIILNSNNKKNQIKMKLLFLFIISKKNKSILNKITGSTNSIIRYKIYYYLVYK